MYPKIDDPQNYSVALYLRLSKEDDKKGDKKEEDDSESIKNQRAMLERYARDQHLTVYGVYIDDGISGTTFDRPGFNRMVDDIKAKKVNMVVTKDMSRLGRDYVYTGLFVEHFFPNYGVRYIALLDNYDTEVDGYSSDMGPFRGVMNDMYAKDVSKKVTSVKHDKQQKGLFIGGKPAYGYKKSPTEKNAIVIDEPAAEIVRYIFQLALEGKSCREIAMILNRQNIPTPAAYAKINRSGKGAFAGKWSSERISYMLQNEVYIGSMVQGRVRKVSYKSKKCRRLPREEWTVVENTHQPLIDRETFEKAGMLLKSRSRTRSRTYDYLLKGMIFCHECGHPLGVINRPLAGNRHALYFVCRTYQRFTQFKTCTCHCARVEDVTNAVLAQIRAICQRYAGQLDFDRIVEDAHKKLQEEKRRQGMDLVDIEAQLEAIQSKIDKSYDDRLSGLVDEEIFQRTYRRLKEEQAALRQKIRALERSDDDVQLDKQKVKELVDNFLNAQEYSRELLVSLIEKIELTEKKEVLIFYRCKELSFGSHLQ